jgi:hypothetical protein
MRADTSATGSQTARARRNAVKASRRSPLQIFPVLDQSLT